MHRGFKGVWIPKEVWLNKDLSIMEKLFLVEIDSLDNEKGCFASNKHFAKFFNLSNSRCSEIINGLKDKGLLNITYERDGKQIKKRIIKVSKKKLGIREIEDPIRKNEAPLRNSEGGYSENTKESNTLFSNTVNNTKDKESMSGKPDSLPYSEIINYLNEKADRQFKSTTKKTQSLIKARFNEGWEVEDFKTVIDKKTKEWMGDSKMENYLRPETLFGTKFESYLNQNMKVVDKEQGGSYAGIEF